MRKCALLRNRVAVVNPRAKARGEESLAAKLEASRAAPLDPRAERFANRKEEGAARGALEVPSRALRGR